MTNKKEIFLYQYLPRLLSGAGLLLTFYISVAGLLVQLGGLIVSIVFFLQNKTEKRELIFASLTLVLSLIILTLAVIFNSRQPQ